MWYNVGLFIIVCILTYFLKKIFDTEPNAVKFNLYFFLYYFVSSLISVVLIPIFLLRPKDVRNAELGCRILKHVTNLLDLQWELRNGHILEEERGAIIVSNHQSSLDILGQFNIWSVIGKMTVIAKKAVFYVWPFGLGAYLAGIVFIDRRKTSEAYKILEETTRVMVKDKTKIWIFPEGTRNKGSRKLLPFKKGAFTIAVNAQVPIIPVVFSPYYFINKKKNIFNKGHIVIKCLEPVLTTGLTQNDVPALMTRIHDLMQAEYIKLSEEVFETLPKDYPYSFVE